MNITLRIMLLVLSVAFLVFVLYRARKGKYLLKYSLIWIFFSVIGLLAAILPDWVVWVADVLGFNVTSNFVYFALIVFLLISNLVLCGILSRQETTIKTLVQEIYILKGERNEDDSTGDI